MKTLLISIISLSLVGCASLPSDLVKGIPNGSWESIDTTVTGKFSSTKILAKGVIKQGKSITAEELHVQHTNLWVPLIEINAVGFKAGAPIAVASSVGSLF